MYNPRFHWCAPRGGSVSSGTKEGIPSSIDFDTLNTFCSDAGEFGFHSILLGTGFHLPDSIALASALSRTVNNVRFLIAYRPGQMSPVAFVQALNTISWLGSGRVDVNIVTGISPAEQKMYGDGLAHQERYDRTEEFVSVITSMWCDDRIPTSFSGKYYEIDRAELSLGPYEGCRPEIYISGGSDRAKSIAERYGLRWLRYGGAQTEVIRDAPSNLRAKGLVGLRMHVIARETEEEARAVVAQMAGKTPDFAHRAKIEMATEQSDSVAVKTSMELAKRAGGGWLDGHVWSGAVADRGGPALCVVGSYSQVMDYFASYARSGITDFILSGWPTDKEMRSFGANAIPLLKKS